MRRYTVDEESRIGTDAHVRAWRRSGLVDEAAAAAMSATLATDLKRTTLILRLVLFWFGTMVLQAALLLVFLTLDVDSASAAAAVAFSASVGAMAIAEALSVRFRLYRFGVEESAAAWSVVAAAVGAALLASASPVSPHPERAAVLVGGLCAAAVYARAGYLYAAIGAVLSAAAVPFVYGLADIPARLVSASILGVVALAAAEGSRRLDGEYPAGDYARLEALAWLGAYVVLNLAISGGPTQPGAALAERLFYWGTFAATGLLPFVALARGIRGRHRWLIRAGLLMALVTLATWKRYLGWPVREWDPILLGIVFAGAALVVRRWLLSGEGEQRGGYTPHPLLRSDAASVSTLGVAAGLAQGAQAAPDGAGPPGVELGGGASGGGGAGSRF